MTDSIWDVRITDTSLRDGSHHKRHQFTGDEVRAIVEAELGEDFELVSCRFERLDPPRLLSVVVSGATAPPIELAERMRLVLIEPVGEGIEVRLEGRLVVRAGKPEVPPPSSETP